jgi:selenocysteine-specific elongation factor
VGNLIIGTAGHVDHGKTELVKALTGRDTDRLLEEKERGISIVLGFAPLDLGEGVIAGVVDVPGHERFVKNMVSGAVGVDIALLVVAADEGVMPQTEEHLEVLRLLGVRHGVVAITKVDLVDDELAAVAESMTQDLLAGGPLEGAPYVRTSVVTGAGVEEVRRCLRKQAESLGGRDPGDFFRMPVDRIFTRSGIGTVVTGTTWSGSVGKGDELVLEPAGKKVRIREVQSFEHTLDRASAGMRTALALHGVRADEVAIGYQSVSPGVLEVSSMLDAVVEVSDLKGSRLKNRQRVRFHHAAGETLARIMLLDRDTLDPGQRGLVQLRLEQPTVARRGDRFVLRSYSPMRVIAGGRILDPVATKKRRFRDEVLETLEILSGGSERDVVLTLAAAGGSLGIPRSELRRFGMGITEIDAVCNELEGEGRLSAVGETLIAGTVIREAEERIAGLIDGYVSRDRLRWGIDREELRSKAGLKAGPLFDFLLAKGEREGKLFFKGSLVRAGSGERELSGEDARILEDLENRIREAGFEFTTETDLAGVIPDAKRLVSYLRILEERRSIVRIQADGFLHTEQHEAMLSRLRGMLHDGGTVSVGDFKDAFGFSRKFAVPLLEYLDSAGFTRRDGDARVTGPKLEEG